MQNFLIKPFLWWFADIIHGKLDQRNGRLEVDFAIGRDARPNDIGQIIQTLGEWCDACDAILGAVENQMVNANNEKERHIKHRATIDEEVQNIKKTLKTQVVVHLWTYGSRLCHRIFTWASMYLFFFD